MPTYFAYGLTIDSEFRLPELLDSDAESAEVSIRTASLDRKPPKTNENGFYAAVDASTSFMYWDAVGGFLVTNGSEILVDMRPDVDQRLMRLPLLGPVMGALLQQRGLLTLHASAVAIDESVVAFLGPKGYGKSTTASALSQRGHPVVTDDVLAVDLSHPHDVQVHAGFPQFKLRTDTAEAILGQSASRFPLLHERVRKKAYRVRDGFPRKALPLRQIYLLDFGSSLESEPVTGQEAFLALLRNTYGRRFKSTPEASANHLDQCIQLAGRVNIHRLTRQHSLDALGDLVRFIEEDVAQLNEASGASR